jgi:hypothetical protein
MEGGMNHHGKQTDVLRFSVGVLVLAILTGCAGGPSQEESSRTFVPITDLGMVAGDWEGMVKKDQSVIPGPMVVLTIRANGTYTFVGQRISDVALGSGFLELRDGRVSGDTDRRIAQIALYDRQGKAVLVVESRVRQTGERYHGELERTK